MLHQLDSSHAVGYDPSDGRVCSDVMQLCTCYVIPEVCGDATSSNPWTQILASLTFHNCGRIGKVAGRTWEATVASTHFTQDPVSTYSFWPGTWAGGTQPLLRLHNANLGHLRHMLAPYLSWNGRTDILCHSCWSLGPHLFAQRVGRKEMPWQ